MAITNVLTGTLKNPAYNPNDATSMRYVGQADAQKAKEEAQARLRELAQPLGKYGTMLTQKYTQRR